MSARVGGGEPAARPFGERTVVVRRACLFGVLWSLIGSPFPGHGADVDRDLPDDTRAVLVVNVRQILRAPVVQRFLQEATRDNGEGALGGLFDPAALKDLERVTVAMPGGDAVERRGVVILRGRFDLARMNALVEMFAQTQVITIKIHTFQKVRFYEIFQDDPPTPLVCSVFLDENTLLLSPSKEAVRAAIARRVAKRPPQIGQDLEALVAKVDRQQGIWVAGQVPDQFKRDLARRPQLKPFAGKVEALSGGVSFTDVIRAGFFVRMADVQGAVDLRQTLEVSKSIAALAIATTEQLRERAPLLTDLLNSLQFSQEKATVGVELTVRPGQIDRAFKKEPKP